MLLLPVPDSTFHTSVPLFRNPNQMKNNDSQSGKIEEVKRGKNRNEHAAVALTGVVWKYYINNSQDKLVK